MTFTTEAAFEEALIKTLKQKGWEDTVLKNPTEADLLRNWADILFENNRSRDRLDSFPLTDGEMQQILEQINELRTPLKLNGFINGKSVSIVRDNEDDTLHFGKEVSLKIYDRMEIAAGQSRYQIVQQPQFKASSTILNDRRGDLMLLINGMPVFHIELKKSGVPVRKDEELEVIAEILNKERFISCHSYIQSEINMLMKVAEKFNFNINTFTHILEGYKVADKMKAHGVGASTFSDWWAYKYEVNDAIPYNGAILHKQGVTVAYNSDDAEMSRRLNQEAAKAVKYGDVSEEDAWKFVTLNPAKLLHLDKNIGSIKTGKDADVVLWNTNPLSIYAKAEKTLIEGVVYFDLERDLQLRSDIKTERNQLINLMLDYKNNGGATQSPKKSKKPHMHCDFEGDYQ